MEDAVRPAESARRAVFERGVRVWSSLADTAVKSTTTLPDSCYDLSILADVPCLPPELDLKEVHGTVYATGTSVWTVDDSDDSTYIEQSVDIAVSTRWSSNITLTNGALGYRSWFGCEDNHIAILVLAWAYILSARWAELVSGSVLEYNSQTVNSNNNQDIISVNAGIINDDAVRWWTAVLSQDGWKAYIPSDTARYKSPWSISLQSPIHFRLSHRGGTLVKTGAISSVAALGYISEYCDFHGITDQSYAALSVALLLPMLSSRGRSVRLPIPKTSHEDSACREKKQVCHEQLYKLDFLDKLLVLSCNTRGIRGLLSSIFYDPEVACNSASPWIQAIITVLKPVENTHLIHVMAARSPHLAFIWPGAIITGLHSDIIKDVRFGLTTVELHSAMWTGTIQSFIQEPLSKPVVTGSYVSRANECRLLYILQEEHHEHWPECPWPPFGQTALEDTHPGVRSNAEKLTGGLVYIEWRWACKEGSVIHHVASGSLVPVSWKLLNEASDIPISYEGFDDEELASKDASRSVFSWLRSKGYPTSEREIYCHEWFYVSPSDEDGHYGAIRRAERFRRKGVEQQK
ncbi:hypothetical protein MGYG_02170 [Nannizzia gypsea CBS 118893]|uniref:Uncharacterized protein n=1 Tax=Arthroderma gypseum (strain ATCC MYA-4604 / CBS 118893) TaxID=535722 RepID=E4UQ24_ARTGP|nr:hypothetical protein MGYG_02170 [Nannizzia gypsea CBS 118893]EFQ99158.1 hypothetical protein MGYG_02170 [Nannizzia gypsea CBS 118893]